MRRLPPARGEARQRRGRGCSSMVEPQPSKLKTWVRFPSPAPRAAGAPLALPAPAGAATCPEAAIGGTDGAGPRKRGRGPRCVARHRRAARPAAVHATICRRLRIGDRGPHGDGDAVPGAAARGAPRRGRVRRRARRCGDRAAGQLLRRRAGHRGAARGRHGAALLSGDAAGRAGGGGHPPRRVRPDHRHEPGLLRAHHDRRGAEPDHHRHDAASVGDRLVGLDRAAQRPDPRGGGWGCWCGPPRS